MCKVCSVIGCSYELINRIRKISAQCQYELKKKQQQEMNTFESLKTYSRKKLFPLIFNSSSFEIHIQTFRKFSCENSGYTMTIT